MNVIEKTITLADGRVITLETGKLAKQADGAVMVKMGNTMLLATVVSAQEAGPDVDFMPLSVDYKEKFASVGRFPGGFTRREGKSSDYEILVSRLVDRALRPLFPDDYHAETFVQVTLYSADEESMPDCLAGASSDSPFPAVNARFRMLFDEDLPRTDSDRRRLRLLAGHVSPVGCRGADRAESSVPFSSARRAKRYWAA